jgi:hypothetical protein
MHHRMKADAPSGTALMLGEAAARGRGTRKAERGRDGTRTRASRARSASPRCAAARSPASMTCFPRPGERLDPVAPRREPDDLRPRRARRGALPRRQAGRPLFDAGRDRLAVTKAEVFEFFRRLAEANPEPTTELDYRQPLHAAGRGRAVGAGDRRQRQHRHARPVRAVKTPAADGRARRGGAARHDQDDRPVQHQGEERHRAVEALIDRLAARCRAPARSSRRCPASAARPPTSCSSTRSSAG